MKNIICPVCKEPLIIVNEGKSAKCENKHLYDFAKHGYLNLLLAQQKKSKSPGDDHLMVKSRSDFLNTGAYAGIANFLIESLQQNLENQVTTAKEDINILDLACGEGYYGELMSEGLSNYFNNQINFTGIDISAPAIKNACKRSKDFNWLIASIANVPLASSSQNAVTGLFFHFDLNEVVRVLNEGGIFLTLNTGPNHLLQLREKIYDKIKDPKDISFDNIPPTLNHRQTLYFRDKIEIKGTEQILNLLRMTPHYWRATKEKKDQLLELSSLLIDIDVQADIFIKN